jgi:heme exporter protein CcmD
MIGAAFIWGKYAAYVWPAYGITLAGILAAVLLIWRSYRRAKERLGELDKSSAAQLDRL